MLFSCNLFASSHSLIWFVCGTRVAPARFMNGGNPCNINALGRQPHDASHARGRRFESASLHHQAAPKKMPLRKAQKFQLFHPIGTQCVIGVQLVRAKARRKLMHLSLRLAFYIRIELDRSNVDARSLQVHPDSSIFKKSAALYIRTICILQKMRI